MKKYFALWWSRKNLNPHAALQSFCQLVLAGTRKIRVCEKLSITLLTGFIYSSFVPNVLTLHWLTCSIWGDINIYVGASCRCWWPQACSLYPSDHGRAGREWPGPGLGRPPSILRSDQDGRGGIHPSLHQNVPEQNLPCVPGQEETQEKRQELVGGQRDPVAGVDPSVGGGEALSPRCCSVSCQHRGPAVIMPIIFWLCELCS